MLIMLRQLIISGLYILSSIASAEPVVEALRPSDGALLIHTRFEANDDSFFTSPEFHKRIQLENFTFAKFLAACEEEERSNFEGMEDASVFFVKLGDDEFLRKVLEVFASDSNILVDNEQGLILPIQEFLRWWQENPTERIG